MIYTTLADNVDVINIIILFYFILSGTSYPEHFIQDYSTFTD